MRVFKRSIRLFLCILIVSFLLPLHAYAININIDIYSGALPLDEFLEKYNTDNKGDTRVKWTGQSDENGVDHATNFILRARPYEGAQVEDIDRISLDYSPQLVLPRENVRYDDIENPDDPSKPSYVDGTVKTWSEVYYEQFETWDEYLQERLDDGWVETTYEGLPAVERWHEDSLDQYERKIPLSSRREIRVLLLDDSHIPGMVMLKVETSYMLSSNWMIGEDAERFMAPIWAKSEEVWKVELKEIGERMLKESFDQTEVTLERVRLYPGKLGEVPKEVKEKQKQQEKERASVEVDTRADKEKGETDVSIPAALAIVIIGSAAAMAGAGAGGDSGDSDRKKTSRYKMCLRKDFGDAIRYDTQPVTVYARIVEITPDGEEIDRPDLSAAIEMFSNGGLKVESTAMAGNYMGALVCAESTPGVQNPESGILSIRFTGEGGSFQNNVTFRLVGDAYISFPQRGKELTPTTYMLYGDDGNYEVPIELCDFTMPPQKVSLELPGDQPFTAEAEKVDDTHYVIRLHNTSRVQTDKVQPQQIIMVTIYAQNDKESAHDNFIVNMLPEGISLRPFTGCPIDENGRLHVACSLTPEQGEDETEIEKTHFQLVLAVSKTDDSGKTRSVLVESSQISYRFEQMTAQIDKLQNLIKAFPYEIDSSEASSAGIFRICPMRQLPQDDRLDYDVALPVSCEYENKTYTLEIPIRLLGDKLLPMAEKSEEISLLIKRIRKFVDEEKRAELIREFKNDLPKMSASDVRLLSKSLVYATQAEVYKANMHLLNAQMLDWVVWGLEWYKWIGDQAISVIISKLSGNRYAPFVEAVVMPAKDLLVEHIGIWLSDYVSGEPSPGAALDIEQLESTGLIMIENTLTNLIDGKTEPKKAAGILSMYLVIRTANYYFYEKNDDGSPIGIYGAVASAFGDLTGQSFKIILGTKLEQLAKNPATTKMFGGYADEFVKGLFPAEFYNNGGEWEFDLIKKYIEEITVLASAKVYSGIQEGAEQDTAASGIIITLIENTQDPEKSVRIKVNPVDLGTEFFNYIFDKLFEMFTFIDSVVESPKDPPCMLA